jgi:hypothetical protein
MTRGGKFATTCRLDAGADESASCKPAATKEGKLQTCHHEGTTALFSEAFERHNDHGSRPHEDME